MNESSGASMPGSDAELLNAIRSGDPGPYDLLRERHAAAARRLAGHLAADQATADDAVAQAFAQVLDAISRGGGPTDAFRPYLLTAVRRAVRDEAGASAQLPIDEQQIPDPGQLPSDQATTGLAGSPVVAAFLSLPERWRAVLWHTAVEGATPAEAARLLGLPEASAVELADQAREGLARAYRPTARAAGHDQAGVTAAGATPGARATTGAGAPADADGASAALRAALAPLVLGEAAAAYLSGLAGSANSAGSGPTDSSGASSGTAAARLSDKLRDSSPRQRTVAVGAGALLAMAAIGGYALTLGPAPGGVSKASAHETPLGVTSQSGSPTQGSSATPSAAPASSAPMSTTAPSSARATAPAAPGNGRRSSRRPPTASTPGVSPTSARPLSAAPGRAQSPPAPAQSPAAAAQSPAAPAQSPAPAAAPAALSPSPAAAGSWLPSGRGPAQVAALGPAALNHVVAVNLGAAAGRLFSLVITGSAGCGQSVHLTVAAGVPATTALPAGTIACGWSPESSAAADSRHRKPGSRSAAAATSTDVGPDPGAGTSSAANSGTAPGSRTGATGGWHRRGWPPATWQWPGTPSPGSQWPTRPWPGNPWPTR